MKVQLAALMFVQDGVQQRRYLDWRCSACVSQWVGCVESVGALFKNMDLICVPLTGEGVEVKTHTTHIWTHTSAVKIRMSSNFTPMLSCTVGHLTIVIVDVFL